MKQKKKQTRQGSDNRAFHLMLLVPVILLFIYNILPIPAGILMAFQNFHPMKGFLHSSFVGLANFKKLMLLPDACGTQYSDHCHRKDHRKSCGADQFCPSLK